MGGSKKKVAKESSKKKGKDAGKEAAKPTAAAAASQPAAAASQPAAAASQPAAATNVQPQAAVHTAATVAASPQPAAAAAAQPAANTKAVYTEAKIATTISAAEAKTVAEACRNAMKGLGTNEKMLIDNIGNKTSADMQLVMASYKSQFNRDFMADIKDECGGKFRDVMVALCTPPADYDASLIKKAVAGLGTDESLLSEVLCTRSNTELKEAAAAYQRLYNRNMENDIKSDTSGDLWKVYQHVLSPNRGTRQGNADADIQALFAAGTGKIGTDEQKFIDIIATASPAHLDALYYGYAQKHGKSLDTVIRDEMGGDTGKALANLATPNHVLFADKILKCMKGMGTEDEKLIRLLCSQRGRHLKAAGKHFLEVNRKTISAWVGEETSGDYKDILLKMCQAEGV